MKYQLPNNRTLELNQEECAESPREWDNLSQMIFFGKHSHLGDKHNIDVRACDNWEEMEELVMKSFDIACIKKVFGYSHSGLTISTKPFSCQWDSGVLGYAIITKKALRENYGVKRISKKLIEEGMSHIDSEVNTLDQYVSGEIYYYNIEDGDGEVEDSCGGFYGDDIKENGVLDNIGEEDRIFVEENLVV